MAESEGKNSPSHVPSPSSSSCSSGDGSPLLQTSKWYSSLNFNGFSDFDCASFSELLKKVLARNSSSVGLKGQPQMFQQTPASSKPKATVEHKSPPGPAAMSVPHTVPAPAVPAKASHPDISVPNKVMGTPTGDDYCWRKYGQKQVKSTKSFRSYYRCTYSDCLARKKVQQWEHTGAVIEIVYIGHHNHDPPQKRYNRLKGVPSSANISVATHVEDPSAQKLDGSDMSNCCTDARQSLHHITETEQQSSSCSIGNVGKFKVEEQHSDVPESKQPFCSNRRESQQSSSCGIADAEIQEKHDAKPSPKKRKEGNCASEATKRHKIVLQNAADGRTSSDGCRWRKYGQKMVKGNSHTRSYYRCSTKGCPARKHLETAINDTTAVTITYEGEHDHDMPVPKKQHSPENPTLHVSSTSSMNDPNYKTEKSSIQSPSAERLDDREGDIIGEKVLELGGEKALDSARTLLSIGIEVKPS